jgi:hypothetical protein
MNESTNMVNLAPQEAVENATATPTEEARVKPYQFRKLGAEDMFPMFNIISKIGIKEFKTFFEGDGLKNIAGAFLPKEGEDAKIDENTVTEMGISVFIEIASILIGNLPKCEADIFQLLSQTSNLSVDQVRKLEPCDFAEMVIDFVKKEEFKDFIKVVSKLFK